MRRSRSTAFPVYLAPHERLALEILAESNGVRPSEILRIGLRLLWRLHQTGRFKVKPRLLWRGIKQHTTQRRRPLR